MHPIERLRFVARADGFDASTLAVEAADALGALSFDARALVTSCRRLLDAHPGCGPLWWVAAHVLASGEPAQAAALVADLIMCDDSPEELGGCLPAGAVVVAAPTPAIDRGLAQRPDVAVRYVGDPYLLRRALRVSDAADATGYAPDEIAAALKGATLVVVEARVAGRPGILVEPDAAALVDAARETGVPVWVLLSTGTVLPAPLFEACAGRSAALPAGDDADPDVDDDGSAEPDADEREAPLVRIGFELLALAVTAEGPAEIADALEASDCPAPVELLTRSR